MSQVFRPSANLAARYSIVGAVALVVVVAFVWVRFNWSPWQNRRDVFVDQPVPFSHEHHVSGLGLDCRYCHASVEVSSTAGMPATHTCMTCHSQLWTEAEMLRPVRESYRTEQPLQWKRVYDLPDYVYFNHSIHVDNGVACETCHGRVDQMPLTYKANALYMGFCLDCHRHPERFIRPREYVFAFGYDVAADEQEALGRALMDHYDIDPDPLTDCSTCHR